MDSFTLLSDGADAADLTAGLATKPNLFTTTAVKTGSYTAAPWELVRCDATGGSFTVTLPSAAIAGQQVAVKLLATTGANTVTVSRAGSDTINNAATTIVLTLTDEAVVFTSNGSGVWTVAQGRLTLTSMDARYRQASRGALTGAYVPVTCHPYMTAALSLSFAKDNWRYAPIALRTDWAVDSLSINTTVAATSGTAALIFGLFACDTSMRPAGRQTDYSSYGSIDLTATAGLLTLTSIGLTIPAGEWYLGCAWTGTATGAPTLTCHSGMHPSVSANTAAVNGNAYNQAVSGATVPSTAAPAAAVSSAYVVWAKNH